MSDERRTEAGWRWVDVGTCPACGGANHREAFKAPDRLHGVPGTFTYRRCDGCGTFFQAPRIADDVLDQAYPSAYYTHQAPTAVPPLSAATARGLRDRLRGRVVAAIRPDLVDTEPGWIGRVLAQSAWLRERAFLDLAFDELIPRRPERGRALDVGCGAGGLMVRLARLGWDVEGLEWDERAAEVARRTGFPVHVGRAEGLGDAKGPYDLIVLSHVFEHLSDPGRALTELSRYLDPQGRIVLVYPNCQSLGAHRFGSFWFGWEVPRHLVLVSIPGLRALARRTGLVLASTRTLPRSAEAHSHFSRAYRRGEAVFVDQRKGSWADRGFAWLESAAVALGAPVGEVIVAAFRHPEGS